MARCEVRYDGEVIEKIEALYDDGETTQFICEWASTQSWQELAGNELVGYGWEQKSSTTSITVALTQERLYAIIFAPGLFGGWKVRQFQCLSFSNIARYQWSFGRTKNTKGTLVGQTFVWACTWEGQAVTYLFHGPPPRVKIQEWLPTADGFMEYFKASMARYTALAAPVDMAAQLRALQALVTEGILTTAEMQRAKELFLGRPPDQRQLMERNLRSLHELRKGGVLNQIEFDIKKQDILARVK